VIGTVGDYLGEGLYTVTDQEDNEHEMHEAKLEVED